MLKSTHYGAYSNGLEIALIFLSEVAVRSGIEQKENVCRTAEATRHCKIRYLFWNDQKKSGKSLRSVLFRTLEGIYPQSKKGEILHFLHWTLNISELYSIFLHWKCHFSYTEVERVTECDFQCNFSVGISVGNFSVSLWLSASSVGNVGFWQLKSCIDDVKAMH